MKFVLNLRKNQAEMLSEMGRKLTARDAMTKPIFIYPKDEVDKILNKLKREDTSVCLVVTKEKKFIGEISDNDIIKLFMQQVKNEPLTQVLNIGYKREFNYKTAKELVNKHKSTVQLNTPINEVIKLVYSEDFNYIPVLDNNKKVIGVITPSSIIGLLSR